MQCKWAWITNCFVSLFFRLLLRTYTYASAVQNQLKRELQEEWSEKDRDRERRMHACVLNNFVSMMVVVVVVTANSDGLVFLYYTLIHGIVIIIIIIIGVIARTHLCLSLLVYILLLYGRKIDRKKHKHTRARTHSHPFSFRIIFH